MEADVHRIAGRERARIVERADRSIVVAIELEDLQLRPGPELQQRAGENETADHCATSGS